MTFITSWTDSLSYLRKALTEINKKGVKRFVWIPLIINVLVFTGLFVYFLDLISGLFSLMTGWGLQTGWDWFDNLSFIEWIVDGIAGLLIVVFGVFLVIIVAYTFTSVAHLIGAPFYGIMAERVDSQYSQEQFPETSLVEVGRRSLIREFQKIAYWLIRAIPLVIINIIVYFTPFNFLMPVVWFFFGAWILGMEYFDYAPDNRGISFKENQVILKQNKWYVLSFGSIMLLLTMIPIVNLVIIPIGVAAGTMLWSDKLNPAKLNK